MGDEEILNPQLFDLGFDNGGVSGGTEVDGDPPSPPTTCFSPVFSAKNSSGGSTPGLKDKNGRNETGMEVSSIFAPYSTALSVVIAIGMELLNFLRSCFLIRAFEKLWTFSSHLEVSDSNTSF